MRIKHWCLPKKVIENKGDFLLYYRKLFFSLFAVLLVHFSLLNAQDKNISYENFKNPASQFRPFVRWWWNGNQPDSTELIRELDLLQKAGIGGVEINPIAMPEELGNQNFDSMEWLSPRWNQMLKIASDAAAYRNMATDLIVGSGWPFGGHSLSPEEQIKRLEVFDKEIEVKETGMNRILKEVLSFTDKQAGELMFVKLFPADIRSVNEVIDLKPFLETGRTDYNLRPGRYKIVWGILQEAYLQVNYGIKGAEGPVLDHFHQGAVRSYLSRLKQIKKDLGIPLSQLIRALFCDSIELSDANWTSDIKEAFQELNTYSIEPYLPFILSKNEDISNVLFSDTIKRVRYDYYKTLVYLFTDRFVNTFQQFCSENDVLCRYQAYGNPWHYGLLEGYLIPDIPESNGWINTNSLSQSDHFDWNVQHGYMIWNKYASSAAHLKGRSVVSCEAMTRTQNVFKTTLEDIKVHDDMNFITGINHSILHGFNYSPPEAGFPGWMRFGTFFSEHNTWWPYLKHWTDYNARLNYIFQKSTPLTEIAILGPTADIWSEEGLDRDAFHLTPWYLNRLWEPISEAGSSCDYINEDILSQAHFEDGKLQFGTMSYKLLIVSEVNAIKPKTAKALLAFAKSGGKILFVKDLPKHSPSLTNALQSDQFVSECMKDILKFKSVRVLAPPSINTTLLDWVQHVFNVVSFSPQIQLLNPKQGVYQLTHEGLSREFTFFTNTHTNVVANIELKTEKNREFQLWDAETGDRKCIQSSDNGKLWFQLEAHKSILLVQENRRNYKIKDYVFPETSDSQKSLQANEWLVMFHHVNGSSFRRKFSSLKDITQMGDPILEQFAGNITYETSFKLADPSAYSTIELGDVKSGLTEVWLNGHALGVRWYGDHSYDTNGLLRKGTNELRIKYVTTLSNYCRSLSGSSTAKRWAWDYVLSASGLTTGIILQ